MTGLDLLLLSDEALVLTGALADERATVRFCLVDVAEVLLRRRRAIVVYRVRHGRKHGGLLAELERSGLTGVACPAVNGIILAQDSTLAFFAKLGEELTVDALVDSLKNFALTAIFKPVRIRILAVILLDVSL